MNNCKRKPAQKLYTVIFYLVLFLLIYKLILPYTSFYYNNPIFTPFTYRLNKTDIVIESGDRFKIYMAGIHKHIVYSSTDFKVAEVNLLGYVTAKKPGTAIIDASVNKYVSKCRVTVVALNYSSITLKKDETKILKVRGFHGRVTWKSSSKKIVSVKKGKIIAIKPGKAKINAEFKGIKLSCSVIVSK